MRNQFEIPPSFMLTEAERRSALWLKLKEQFETMLRDKRGKNDGALDMHETASMRGQIACLKGIIALGKEPPQDG